MAPIDAHHHRSTTKLSHKAFKSRHATKGLLKDRSKGKIDERVRGSRKTPHQQVMSKIDRRHQARQLKSLKHLENVKSANVFSGQHGAPRVVVVVPLCEDLDSLAAVQKLYQDAETDAVLPSLGPLKVRVDRFKQNIIFVPVRRDLFIALDACRAADFVIFLLSPAQEVDTTGNLILRTVESQGISNVLVMVQDLDKLQPAKRRPQAVASLKTYISQFFPAIEKVYSLDSDQQCANVIRSLCTITPKGVNWREDRSWMLVEDAEWPVQEDSSNTNGEVILTGVVRSRGMKANRLVQVGDWGNFQIDKITDAKIQLVKRTKGDDMTIDVDKGNNEVLEIPDGEQDDLAGFAPYDAAMEDISDKPLSEVPTERRGVLLDDHHYFSDDETNIPDGPKYLPRGTSKYQSAWFLDDMLDSDSDIDDIVDEEGDIAMDTPALPQDGTEGLNQLDLREPTEATPSEYPQSEMFLDPSPDEEAAQLQAYRSGKRDEAKEDIEFPDEIELHPNVLARERLAKYRGLKSLNTSHWETNEDKVYEPEDWNRLLHVPEYKKSKSQVTREALVGGVQPGTRVHVHLRNVPFSLQKSFDPKKPLAVFTLLRHEQKNAVLNFNITLNSNYPNPIKSKDELLLQCGSRRMVINPLFSQTGNTPNNVHKFQRYLHPGQTAMATFVAPLTWGPVPALFFKQSASPQEDKMALDQTFSSPDLEFIGTGTSQPPDRSRVIAKRVILTGHPFKIHKKLVTVRYMFFNKGDVDWFKALQLWTKRGRSGYIKESLGTHGYFKATFDGRINPQDSVGVSLYKRVFPRNARAWTVT